MAQSGAAIGLNTQVGIKYFVARHWVIFTEWKYILARIGYTSHDDDPAATIGFRATYSVHHVAFGIGYHLRLALKTLPAHGTRPAHYLAGVRKGFKTLGAHRLAPVHKLDVHYSARREPHYSSRRGPHCRRACGSARLGARGWAGENDGLFDHPTVVFSSCATRADHRSSRVPQ